MINAIRYIVIYVIQVLVIYVIKVLIIQRRVMTTSVDMSDVHILTAVSIIFTIYTCIFYCMCVILLLYTSTYILLCMLMVYI